MFEKTCPICNGAGKQRLFVKHRQTGRFITVIDWCLCVKAQMVSKDPNYTILECLDGNYIKPEEVDPQLKFDLLDLRNSPNLLIESNTQYESFLYHLKSFIMIEKYKEPSPIIYACTSMDILKRFYVAQDDKTCPGLQELNKYDLLAIILGSAEKNDQLNTCIAQVVANRKDIRKPTWIYLKLPYDACVWEKSDMLKMLLDLDKNELPPNGYKKIVLKDTDKEIKPKLSKVKKTAEKGIF